MTIQRRVAGKCEVMGVTVGFLGRSWSSSGVRAKMAKHGGLVRSHCHGDPALTVGLRSLLRAGRDAPLNIRERGARMKQEDAERIMLNLTARDHERMKIVIRLFDLLEEDGELTNEEVDAILDLAKVLNAAHSELK